MPSPKGRQLHEPGAGLSGPRVKQAKVPAREEGFSPRLPLRRSRWPPADSAPCCDQIREITQRGAGKGAGRAERKPWAQRRLKGPEETRFRTGPREACRSWERPSGACHGPQPLGWALTLLTQSSVAEQPSPGAEVLEPHLKAQLLWLGRAWGPWSHTHQFHWTGSGAFLLLAVEEALEEAEPGAALGWGG